MLEIGPGLGILTSELLRKARRVVAVELDRSLAAHLRRRLRRRLPGFELVPGNALSLSTDELIPPGEPFDVVANLPYSVGTAILRHLLEQPRKPRRLDRDAAEGGRRPPDRAAAGHERPERRHAVLRRAAPGLHRLAGGLHPAAEGRVRGGHPRGARRACRSPPTLQPLFFKIVNAGFRQKRKQVANSIADVLQLPKGRHRRLGSETLGRRPLARRAETLSVDEWVGV